MGQKTIPQLDEATSFDENALIPIDTGIQSFKVTGENFAKSIANILRPLVVTTSADHTLAPSESLIRASGNHTITMYPAADGEGRRHTIKKTDSGTTTTIAFDGAEDADGETTLSLTEQYSFFELQSNGTTWDIVNAG
jgi:hypothetical protein